MKSAIVGVAILSGLLLATVSQAAISFEDFEDPNKWVETNSRVPNFGGDDHTWIDYGMSNLGNIHGSGEAGGAVGKFGSAGLGEPVNYSVELEETFDLSSEGLFFEAYIHIPQMADNVDDQSHHFFIGYMNQDEYQGCCDADVWSGLGMSVERWGANEQWLVPFGYIRGGARQLGNWAESKQGLTKVDFAVNPIVKVRMEYDPNGGEDGLGHIANWVWDLDGNLMVDGDALPGVSITADHRAGPTSFSAFGIKGQSDGAGTDPTWWNGWAYADDITFFGTAVPEPATLGLLVGAGLLMLRRKH